MLAKLWNIITQPILTFLGTVMGWIWNVIDRFLEVLWAAFDGVFQFGYQFVFGIALTIGRVSSEIVSWFTIVTGFNVTQMWTVWNIIVTGYTTVEFFLPVTAMFAILFMGFQVAVTIRIARWIICCIPWPTANG